METGGNAVRFFLDFFEHRSGLRTFSGNWQFFVKAWRNATRVAHNVLDHVVRFSNMTVVRRGGNGCLCFFSLNFRVAS